MLSLNGSVKATSTLTFSGVGYHRWFDQRHVDGNIGEFGRCGAGVGAPPAGTGISALTATRPTTSSRIPTEMTT